MVTQRMEGERSENRCGWRTAARMAMTSVLRQALGLQG
jgi:hypothetical protein